MKCSVKQDTTRNIPRSISFSPLHFVLYLGKLITFGTVEGAVFILLTFKAFNQPAAVCNDLFKIRTF